MGVYAQKVQDEIEKMQKRIKPLSEYPNGTVFYIPANAKYRQDDKRWEYPHCIYIAKEADVWNPVTRTKVHLVHASSVETYRDKDGELQTRPKLEPILLQNGWLAVRDERTYLYLESLDWNADKIGRDTKVGARFKKFDPEAKKKELKMKVEGSYMLQLWMENQDIDTLKKVYESIYKKSSTGLQAGDIRYDLRVKAVEHTKDFFDKLNSEFNISFESLAEILAKDKEEKAKIQEEENSFSKEIQNFILQDKLKFDEKTGWWIDSKGENILAAKVGEDAQVTLANYLKENKKGKELLKSLR